MTDYDDKTDGDTAIGHGLVLAAAAKVRDEFCRLLSECGEVRRRPVRVDEYGNLIGYRELSPELRDPAAEDQAPLPSSTDPRLESEINDLEERLALCQQRCEALAEMNAALRKALTLQHDPPSSPRHPGTGHADFNRPLTWMGSLSKKQFSDVLRAHPVPSLAGSYLPRAAGFTAYPIIRGIHTSIPFWCESDSLTNHFGILEIAFHKGFCWLTVADYPDAGPTTALEVQKILWGQEVRD